MPNPREEGRKLDFVFLFVRTTLARLGDTAHGKRAIPIVTGVRTHCRARRQDDFRSRETECGASRLPCYCPRASDSPLFCLARAESLARARALSSLSRLSPTLANFMPPRGRPPLADLEHLSTG